MFEENDVYVSDRTKQGVGSSRKYTHLIFFVKLMVSSGILYYLGRKINWQAVFAYLQQSDPISLGLGALALLLQVAVVGAAWHVCLRFLGARIHLRSAIKIGAISLFFNQVVPASVGGIAARTLLVQREGISLRVAVGSVLLDRFCNLFVLVLFVCFSIVLAYVLQLDRSSGFAVFILVAIAAFFLGGLVFINADKFLDRFCNQLFWQKVCWLTKNFRSFISNPSYLTQGLAYGFLWHLLTVLALYAFANAVGLNINFIHFLTVTPIALLLILVPISVAGWGVREGVLVFLLGLLGAPKEQVLAMSLIFGIVQLITRITGMILWAATPTDRRTLKKNTAEKENG